MMNFSDETVEKVAKAIEDKNWGEPDAYPYMAQAALSSLTLADLMQVEEVRELVEAGNRVSKHFHSSYENGRVTLIDPAGMLNLKESLTPFTEATHD